MKTNNIRLAESEDVDDLSILFDAYRCFYKMKSDKEGAKVFLEKRIEKEESLIFICFDGEEKQVGFVQVYRLFSSTRMQPLWLLNDLYVIPEFRGKHISVKLIEKVQKECYDSGACGLLLETQKSNTIGNNLYPKTGFKLDKEHNYYYWDC